MNFLDFITGGIFNVIGAGFRKLFSKEKFSVLVEEQLSNSRGMLIMTVFLLLAFACLKFSILK